MLVSRKQSIRINVYTETIMSHKFNKVDLNGAREIITDKYTQSLNERTNKQQSKNNSEQGYDRVEEEKSKEIYDTAIDNVSNDIITDTYNDYNNQEQEISKQNPLDIDTKTQEIPYLTGKKQSLAVEQNSSSRKRRKNIEDNNSDNNNKLARKRFEVISSPLMIMMKKNFRTIYNPNDLCKRLRF